MVFFGDLFQLPPILKDDDWTILEQNYKSRYFFDAQIFEKFHYKTIELSKIFRQDEKEKDFITLLNNIRVNTTTDTDIEKLNSRLQNIQSAEDRTYLTARRETAETKNSEKLAELPGQTKVYKGEISGGFSDGDNSDYRYPAPLQLELKKNARIMMLNNDSAKRWVNGTRGIIEKLEDDKVTVRLYETLIPGNLRIKARQKLESVGFDFSTFDFEEV
jgi:ATP-dependent exoDNAse (exonuclease V) alpha subunit